jgi:uncharacterized protein YdeI (BOF family)
MMKTWIWIVVGVLAAGALGAVALLEFGPRPEREAAVIAKGSAPIVGAQPQTADPSPVSAPAATASVGSAPAAARSASPTIDELIQSAAAYDGATVSLSGTILTQCTAGCEFALDDSTGVLAVQLEGRGKDRLIPLGKVGKRVAVQGAFHAFPRPQIVIEDPNGWQFVK